MDNQIQIEVYSKEFSDKVSSFRDDWYRSYKKISKSKTPQVDGTGKKIIDKRPDGYDYIIEGYMRDCLDKHFPGWSWEAAAPMQVVLNFMLAQGHLVIIDERLTAFGVAPPLRRFYGVGASRIQFKKGGTYSPENVVDIDKNAKSANSAALKYAINRLTRIGDDVYGKRIEDEGAGTVEELATMTGASQDTKQKMFNQYVKETHLTWSKIFEVLGVKSISEITNYKLAIDKINGHLRGGDT